MRSAEPRRREPTLADQFWRLTSQPITSESNPVEVVERFLTAIEGDGSIDMSAEPEANTLINHLRSEEVEGDLHYASPEQVRGESLDQRSLVFSVGVLLFEQLTGRHPFGATQSKRRDRLRKARFESGVNYFPKIPAELRAVVVKAIAAFPEERWNNLADLKRQLEACVRLLRMPEARRAIRGRKLPAIPDHNDSRSTHKMSPLRGDSRIERLFAPVETRDQSVLKMEVDTGTYRLPPRSRRGLFAALGASLFVLGAIAFVLTSGRGDSTQAVAPGPVKAESAPAPVKAEPVLVEVKAEPAKTEPAKTEPAKTEPAKTEPAPALAVSERPTTTEPVPVQAKKPVPTQPAPSVTPIKEEAGVFSLDHGSKEAARVAHSCFAPNRLARGPFLIGATLRYAAGSSVSSKAYLGGTRGGVTPAERGCLSARLKGLSVGGPALETTMVLYNITVKQSGAEASARVESH